MNAIDLFLRLEVERVNPINGTVLLTPVFYKEFDEWLQLFLVDGLTGKLYTDLSDTEKFDAVSYIIKLYRQNSIGILVGNLEIPDMHINQNSERKYHKFKMIPKYVFLVNPFIAVQSRWLLILTRLYKEVDPEALRSFYNLTFFDDSTPDLRSAPKGFCNAVRALWNCCNDTGYSFVPSAFIDVILDTNDEEKREFDYLINKAFVEE